jgi:hypothetical protein
MTKRKSIMFVDFENFYYALKNNHHYENFQSLHMLKIMDHLRNACNCEILYSPIYADWGQLRPEFQVNCVRAGCNPIYVSCFNYMTNTPKKDVVDKNIIIDCMEWLLLRESAFDILILISGDHDFMPLVEKFMNYGKDVIICPVKATGNTEIIEAATDTFFIDDILSEELELCRSEYARATLKGAMDLQEKFKDRPLRTEEKHYQSTDMSNGSDKRKRSIRKIVDAVYEKEKTMHFVSLTHFRDKILPDFMTPEEADGFQNRKNYMRELMESDYFTVAQINNPKKPEFKTTIIGVNRNNTIIWQWYPELSKVTKELENIFEENEALEDNPVKKEGGS